MNFNYLVKFNDVDHAGRIYFAQAFHIAHQALEDYWQNDSKGWAHWFNNPEWIVPIVHAEANFLGEVRAGESLNCEIQFAEKGNSSISLAYQFANSAGKKVMSVNTKHVVVDKATGQPRSVPEDISELFSNS